MSRGEVTMLWCDAAGAALCGYEPVSFHCGCQIWASVVVYSFGRRFAEYRNKSSVCVHQKVILR
jgi:hypothetical protein